ncbi:MAG: hypothetical protein ABIR55_04410 [Burkholderiaceae bacterium]
MPDANASAQLATLQPAGADQFLAMVQFPPGWTRLHAGHYAVDEEFFVLSGDLHINGLFWHSQQYGFVPADTLRLETRSVGGCTAYARFHGNPRWLRGNAAHGSERKLTRTADWRQIKPETCDNHFLGRLLHERKSTSTWVLDAWPTQPAPVRRDATDALDLSNWNHFRNLPSAGQPAPSSSGPFLLHSLTAPTMETTLGI